MNSLTIGSMFPPLLAAALMIEVIVAVAGCIPSAFKLQSMSEVKDLILSFSDTTATSVHAVWSVWTFLESTLRT